MQAENNTNTDKIRRFILGVPVDICRDPLSAAIDLHSKGGGQIVTLNSEILLSATRNCSLLNSIRSADLIIADSAGITWALRTQGINTNHFPGIDLARSLLTHAESNDWKVALIGSKPRVINRLIQIFSEELPKLQLILSTHGYHRQESWRDIEASLKKLNPDLVLVALGSPLQETWSCRVKKKGCPGLWIGVGGSFDVWSGLQRRAPQLMQKLQIEWLYRLVKDPCRLGRVFDLSSFVLGVFLQTKQTSKADSTKSNCSLPNKNQ